MKTAMQQLIELIENGKTTLSLIENHKQIWLEREKEQIINAHETGYNDSQIYTYTDDIVKQIEEYKATQNK